MTGVWLLMAAGCLGQTGKEGGSKGLSSTPRGVVYRVGRDVSEE